MSSAAELVTVLRERGWTLGIAESLTGGAVAAEIVTVPGASATLLGAVVAYATPVKHSLLHVDGALLDEHGPVHPEVARQMAEGVRRAMRVAGEPADLGVSTTGIAGPDSPDGQAVGTVYIGIATPTRSQVIRCAFTGSREQIRMLSRDAAIAAALDAARE